MAPRVGVCSWSLRPESAEDLADKLDACGISAVQLALDPLRTGDWPEAVALRTLADRGVSVLSGMMGMQGEDYTSLESIKETGGVAPDEHWETNLLAAADNARLASRMGLTLVTLHAGFIPHDLDDPQRMRMLDRLGLIARTFEDQGVFLGLETGQEQAATLLQVLQELESPTVGINFDPANMILYGMGEPVDALKELAPHVRQIHVKDALPTKTPGTWGEEVPAGTGAVDWKAFFEAYRAAGLTCDLVIEREAGEDRIGDVRAARELVEGHIS